MNDSDIFSWGNPLSNGSITKLNLCILHFFFIKQVDGLIEAKGGFSLMVIMYTCLAKVRVQGQHYTLVLYILWYQNPMQMDGWWYFILWYHGSGVQSQNFSDIMMWYKFLGREGGPWKKITFERGAAENYFP